LLPAIILIALRLPSLFEGYWYGDEGIYAAIGQGIKQGKHLYTQVWDHKPPLIYLLYGASASIGWHIGWPLLKLFNIFLGLTTLMIINRILKKLDLGDCSGFLSLILLAILLGSTLIEGNSLNAENIFIVINTATFLLLLNHKHFTIVGLLIFLSLMTKVSGLIELLLVIPIFSVIFFKRYSKEIHIKAIKRMMLGFFPPFLLLLTYFQVRDGTLWNFFYSNILFNTNYSLHQNNFTSIINLQIPNTLFKAISTLSVSLITSFWYIKGAITKRMYLIINLFTIQLFSSLLSGKNYGHYFIQTLPAITLITALVVKKMNSGFSINLLKKSVIVLILLIPMMFAIKSVGVIPIYAHPNQYYRSFYQSIFLRGDGERNQPWWHHSNEVKKIKHFAKYFNDNYTDDLATYIYTNKPWLVALIENKFTNKYVTWFHLTYRYSHLEESKEIIKSSDLIIIDKDIDLLPEIFELTGDHFSLIDTYENFDILKRNK